MAKSNKIEWLQDNIQAIRAAYRINNGKEKAGDKELVQKFHGWGNLKEVNAIGWNSERNEVVLDQDAVRAVITAGEDSGEWLHELYRLVYAVWDVTENEDRHKSHAMIEAIKTATLTSFYTPTPITKAIGAAVSHTFDVFGIKTAMVLDPSAGAGAFLNIVSADKLQHPQYAIEKDPLTAMILQAQHPEAKVINKGFEDSAQDMPYGEFDVVASNIPFGQVRVSDPKFAAIDGAHRTATTKLHAYYFLKGLEACKNGGILAFITTRGIADSQDNQYVRDYLCKHGNLLAAYRLPDNMFVNSAGIEVGSDLLIWQRDDNKSTYLTIPEQMFRESLDKEILGEIVPSTNRLLSQRQQALYTDFKVCKNQFGKMAVRYNWSDSIDTLALELQRRLTRDMELYFRKTTWLIGNNEVLHNATAATVPDASPSGYLTTPTKRAGNLAALEKARQARAAQVVATEQMRQPLADIIDAVTVLNSYERANRKPNDELRRLLNDRYDQWLQQFGPFHLCADRLKTLPDWQMAMTLEIADGNGKYRKADVFHKPVTFTYIDPNHKFEPREAMCIVLNELGYIDMPRLEELTKLTEPDIYQALKGELFLVPRCATTDAAVNSGTMWQHKSLVINGDVISKRKQCDAWLKNEATVSEASASDYVRYVTYTRDCLLAATPKAIPYGEDGIKVQLGARWLPTDFTERFANHIFRTDCIKVEYNKESDNTIAYATSSKCGDADCRGTYGVEYQNRRQFTGLEVLNMALKDKCPNITYKVGDREFVDHDAIRIVQKAIDKMKQDFKRFMYGGHITKKDRERIERIYNEKFNAVVRASFDGSFQTLPNCHLENMGIAAPYQSQLDCIWMLKQNGGGVCWHQVGAGKTLIMCVTAYEMSRLGIAHKPLIIGLKANVGQIADTFRKLYPDARLLYCGKDDFTEANRTTFFNKIANNDWDCIIMTHEQFGKIPNSKEMERSILEHELDDVDNALKFAQEISGHGSKEGRKVMLGLQTRKANLTAKMETLTKEMHERQDDVIDFEKMGIGHIFVDEYHYFKNLTFTTRHNRVAGLGNSTGSKKALHLLTAIRTIQKRTGRDLGASFFSGTVVANALTELYVLFKYLLPNEMHRQGIDCFDSWANTFIEKSNEYELAVTGGLKQKERFRNYINVPEMTLSLRQITDYRTAKMMNLDIPRANVIFKESDPTADQKMMIDRIRKFAESGSWDELRLPYAAPDNLKKSIMLVATDLARKTSLDTRLLSEEMFGDDPNNKSSQCAASIADYYRKYNEHKGTQMVFCDIATPTGKGFNIYDDIKRKLVNMYGIPAKEIAFIHDYKSDSRKLKLFAQLNSGEVRVVFGSTQMLGTGVNAQQRVVAIHHLDIPWRPADMEQRNGRAVRKGNEVKIWGNNTVDIIVYGTRNTLDAYKFNLLKTKEAFINQINDENNASRTLDEGAASTDDDGNTSMSFAEFAAALSGNTDLIEMAKLTRQIDNLLNDRAAFQRSIDRAKAALAQDKQDLDTARRNLTNFLADQQAFNGASQLCCDGALIITGAKDQSLKEQGRYLFDIRSRYHSMTPVGTVLGFPLHVNTKETDAAGHVLSNIWLVTMPSGYKYPLCNNLGMSHESAVAALSPEAVANKLALTISNTNASITKYESDLATHTTDAAARWDGDTELATLTSRRDAINDRINADLAARERQQQDAAVAAAERQAASERSASRRK